MLTILQAVFLGLLQGFTELFPISSLGHSVIVPAVLRWNVDQSSDEFLSFVVLTHLATALVMIGFFWREWVAVILGVLRSIAKFKIDTAYGKLGWLIVVSTIPAGILGFLFQSQLQSLFGNALLVATILFLNGLLLYAAEFFRKPAAEGRPDDRQIAHLSWSKAIVIGFAQCLALIPGFSRTGSTMTAGLIGGLSHENAARYSFFLAGPIILAAAALKAPHVLHYKAGLPAALIGALCAAASAYVSVRFLVRYFEAKTLKPFALYCMAAAIVSIIALTV